MKVFGKRPEKDQIFLKYLRNGATVLAAMRRSGMDWREVQEQMKSNPEFALLCLKSQDDLALSRVLRLSSLAQEAINVLEQAVLSGDRHVALELVKHLSLKGPVAQTNSAARERPSTQFVAGSPRLLIVEDEPPLREFVSERFRHKGFEVVEARSAEEALLGGALADIYAGPPDLDCLLLDVHLPGISGIQIAGMVQENWPDTPIIFMTGDVQKVTEAEAMEKQPIGYVLKPFDFVELEALVQQAVESRPRRITSNRQAG